MAPTWISASEETAINPTGVLPWYIQIIASKNIYKNIAENSDSITQALDTIDDKDGYLGGAACYCGLVCGE